MNKEVELRLELLHHIRGKYEVVLKGTASKLSLFVDGSPVLDTEWEGDELLRSVAGALKLAFESPNSFDAREEFWEHAQTRRLSYTYGADDLVFIVRPKSEIVRFLILGETPENVRVCLTGRVQNWSLRSE